MLIEFRVENYRSLRDEQALTFEAGGTGDESDLRPRQIAGNTQKLLPAAAIYGPNASGKSNVLAALAFMREAVLYSHRRWEPQGGIPRAAFAWGGKRAESTTLVASFVEGISRFEYGFCVNDEIVEEEWLFAWPNNRKQVWFERDGDSFRFGEHLKGLNELVKEVTRNNALFLSAAAQHGHKQLLSLYGWFCAIYPFNIAGRERLVVQGPSALDLFASSREKNLSMFSDSEFSDSLASHVRNLFQYADLGIVDIKRVPQEVANRGNGFLEHPRILLQHQANDDDSWLALEEESKGTKTLFRMAPFIFRALETGGLLLVDELESSLHPLIGHAIVKLFNCPKANPRNAQLLFTTHDTNMLGTTIGDPPLRRDQVWFTEKDDNGATNLYPLTDYKPRKAENLERGYLQGRYGAIPFLGDLSWISG